MRLMLLLLLIIVGCCADRAEERDTIRAEVEAQCDSLRRSDSLRITRRIDSIFRNVANRAPQR
jgi:hypothetical protein